MSVPHTRSFTTLPAEIRNKVYNYLFANAVIEDLGLSPKPIRTKNYHLGITMTSHQIRIESLSVLRSLTTLHFRMGQAGAAQIPPRVAREIRTIRIAADRLKSLDTASFENLETLILDVSIDPPLWKLYMRNRNKKSTTPSPSLVLADVSDIVHLSMTLGVFEYSWDVEKIWRDTDRKFRMLCWISLWVAEDKTESLVLVDIDKGLVLEEGVIGT